MATDIQFRLENAWHPVEGDTCGAFVFTLVNLSDVAIRDFRLAYTSLTRVRDFEEPFCENAVFVKRNANFHQFAPPAGFVLEPGACWIFRVGGLWRAAKHRTDGAKSAYLTLASGQHLEVAVADLMPGSGESTLSPALLPEGKADHPFAMLPWPALADLVAGDGVPVALYPAEGASLVELRAVENILRLFCRLFAASPAPLSLAPVHQGRAIAFQADAALGASACRLTFSADGITLVYGDVAGLQYALTLLAQILHGARSEPDIFRFPVSGTISDRPRYGWRGCHLDVSRQFYPVADVKRLIDILAWFRMNIFHWHLSDDEAWRLEIKAFAQLTTIGVLRGPDERLLPQLGNGAEPVGGFYTQNEVRDIVAHASALQIEVVPEIDIPGHSTAMLVALPDLVDRQEPPDSYRSIQGYPNNALNPAIEYTYEVLGKVFDEMVEIFPSKLIHVGGDEVAADTWMASPLARNLMVREGIEGTLGLQSHFMKRIQKMLAERGRNLAGWDEVSHGGGVIPQNTLLMAWQKPEAGLDLARQGYDVVMSPGQAYYLDMVQDEAFQEPGASWAGTVPPKHTYTYEAVAEFPPELADRIKGVQACIWCEHFLNRDHFNHLVFPRLPAIAEAAWTPRENKDWLRFAAIVRLSPRY